jgi:hypothetical protein
MGFFDSVLDPASQGGTQGDASATATVAAPAAATTDAEDFLIIDDSVGAEAVPNTVSEAVVEVPTATVEISAPAASDAITFDEPAVAETASQESAISEIVPAEASVEAVAESAPSVMETVETPVMETPAVEIPVAETASSFSFGISETSATTAETAQSSAVNPDEVLKEAVSKLEAGVSAKETERDAAITENAEILAKLAAEEEAFKIRKAELKKQASEAQERAKEIDASADRSRAIIANLKSQIAA